MEGLPHPTVDCKKQSEHAHRVVDVAVDATIESGEQGDVCVLNTKC
jgi:hypothetical protein